MWSVILYDPRYDWEDLDIDDDDPDWDEEAFAAEHNETYEYRLLLDAQTGEIIEAWEDTYGAG